MSPRRVLTVLMLVAAGSVAVASPAAAADPGLTATFSSADHGSWRKATFMVANPTGAAVTGWTLELDVPAGLEVGQGHNGTLTRMGDHVTVTNAHYNATLAPGATTEPHSFFFVAGGADLAPLNCRVNGAPCDAGAADTTPPTAPANLRVVATTDTTITVAWDPATDDSGIARYELTTTGGGRLPTIGYVLGTSSTVSFLRPQTAYQFTVRARDTAGNSSATVGPLTVTTAS
jgi:chitinase